MPDVIGIDHIYIAVTDLHRSERFYDLVMIETLGFRKNTFTIGGDPHIQYFNRHFGFVLRPAREVTQYSSYAPGLHHFCLRVDSTDDVRVPADRLRALGIPASEAKLYPDYARDYAATFLEDPDGIRLEITNYRAERRERHDRWESLAPGSRGEVVSTQAEIYAVVRRYADAWAANDLQGVIDSYHDDIVFYYAGCSPLAGVHCGKSACLAALKKVRERTNRKLLEILDVSAGGRFGFVVALERFERDGKAVQLRRVLKYTVRDGKLAECWVYDEDQRLVDQYFA